MQRFSIGIDGYNLALPQGTGVATYGFTLATLLHDAGHRVEGIFGIDAGDDPALREILFFDALGRATQPSLAQRRLAKRRALNPFLSARAAPIPLTGRVERAPLADRIPPFDGIATSPGLFGLAHRFFANHGRFLRVRMADPPAIMHWTYPVPVELVGARNIYTLHDLVPLKLPFTTLDNKAAYRRLIARCATRAAHLCTVSEASRADIIAEFGVAGDRISNSWQASPLPPALLDTDPATDAALVERAFALPHRGYFLFFGAIEPKKNVGRLLEAFLSLDTATPLVLAGGRGWQSDAELALLPPAREGAPDAARRIIRLDHLPRTMLLRLIRGARAVLFPSLYEGFGLPVLEAMQLGTPVLTSRTSALPEVAGDAALLVDPYDPAAIAAAIRRLDTSPELRAHCAAAGLQQARRFAPDAYLARLTAMYAATMAQPPLASGRFSR